MRIFYDPERVQKHGLKFDYCPPSIPDGKYSKYTETIAMYIDDGAVKVCRDVSHPAVYRDVFDYHYNPPVGTKIDLFTLRKGEAAEFETNVKEHINAIVYPEHFHNNMISPRFYEDIFTYRCFRMKISGFRSWQYANEIFEQDGFFMAHDMVEDYLIFRFAGYSYRHFMSRIEYETGSVFETEDHRKWELEGQFLAVKES